MSYASSYALREEGAVIYEGPNTSYHVSDKPAGRYCYTVTAANSAGVSSASNSVCTDVPPEAIPRPGYWSSSGGSQWFTVNADRSRLVPTIRISVPACGATVEIELTSGATINATTHAYSWSGSFYGSGSFSSATAASGNMGLTSFYVYGCGYVTAGPISATYAWQHASAAGIGEAVPAELTAPDDGGPQDAAGEYRVTVEPWSEHGPAGD